MHTTTPSATRLATTLATTLAIGAAIAASLLSLPANAVRSASCEAFQTAAVVATVAEQPGPGGLLGMARATLGAWIAVPERPLTVTEADPASPQSAPVTTRSVTAPLTVAELDARVSRYRHLPSSSVPPPDESVQALAHQQSNDGTDRRGAQWANNRACQP